MFDYIQNILAKTHAKEQALRFARIFALALLPQLVFIGSGHFDRTAAISAVIAALETAFRQVYRASTWAAIHRVADSTPAEPPASAVQ